MEESTPWSGAARVKTTLFLFQNIWRKACKMYSFSLLICTKITWCKNYENGKPGKKCNITPPNDHLLHLALFDTTSDGKSSGNFSIRFWREYMSLFASVATRPIVSLLLTSNRKVRTVKGFVKKILLHRLCHRILVKFCLKILRCLVQYGILKFYWTFLIQVNFAPGFTTRIRSLLWAWIRFFNFQTTRITNNKGV